MRRITLVIPCLTSGGAERVMTTLANAWAAAGSSVKVLAIYDIPDAPFYPLHPAVEYRPLALDGISRGVVQAVKNNVGRLTRLRREIADSKPDVVLSFLDTTNVLTLLATRGLGIPVIVEEHTDPAAKQLSGGWTRLRPVLYPKAARVVVLSEASRAYFAPKVRAKTVIIPNPIVVEPPAGKTEPRGPRMTAIALGRLGPEKGYDLLLDAWARIAAQAPEWHLTIWGDGPLRAELEARRDELGLQAAVCFAGRTKDPHTELRRADLFVMSSRREGFPMALGEAMACGLPVVSTDCQSGPRQIIRDGVDGLLVPPEDPAALAGGMLRVMQDDELRARLAARAPEVLERFGLDRVLSIWGDLFNDAIGERTSRK